MLLLLVRHADAGERDPARWPDDTLRPITEKGRKIQGKVVNALRDAAVAPEVVLTSPWLRAAQTAELLTQGLGIAAPVPAAALAADPDLGALDAAVGPRKSQAVVALVGHAPWIEELAALLLTGSADGLAIDFPKSAVLGVEVDRVEAKGAALRFLLRPKML
jgi:phosphohistidine phosphatase